MIIVSELRSLNREQRAAFVASFLGWTLDAFDFFLMVYVISAIATDYHSKVKDIAYGLTLTLMFRPLGAFIFGRLADRFGRRPVLMADVLLFSALELATAFAPTLTVFLILRAVFGIAMGGEWGIGSSLVMESIPTRARGVVSGILQEGYALGNLLAGGVYWLLFDRVGWRGMFIVGVIPALLVVYIRLAVKESPVWRENRQRRNRAGFFVTFARNWKLMLYAVILMTAFTFFSHGTQDMYPTFLQVQHKLSTQMTSTIAAVGNVGAIMGGICFGAFSQRRGRRATIVMACLLSLPIIPLWAFASTPLLLGMGAFLMQVAVQGAWGIIPAHLNEISPIDIRGTFPGLVYQIGNLLSSKNSVIQANLAEEHHGNYGYALALVATAAALVIAVLIVFGPEARDAELGLEPVAQPG